MDQKTAIERLDRWLVADGNTSIRGPEWVRLEYLRMLSEQTAALVKQWVPNAAETARDQVHAIIEMLEV